MLSAEINRVLREDHAETDKKAVQEIIFTFDTVCCFQNAVYH